jgi:hypothetical protein
MREPHGSDAKNNPGKQRCFKGDGADPTAVTAIAVPEMPLGSSLLSVAASSTNSMGGEARSTFTGLCTLLSSCMKTPANLEKLLDGDFSKRASGGRLDLDQSPAS